MLCFSLSVIWLMHIYTVNVYIGLKQLPSYKKSRIISFSHVRHSLLSVYSGLRESTIKLSLYLRYTFCNAVPFNVALHLHVHVK